MPIAESRRSGLRSSALLCVLCLGLYLPGLTTIPPLDRDEARFAQATRQMLQTGDFLRIRFQDEARNKKPAGIYWLQAASVAVFSTADSTAMWPYRLPSLLGAIGAVLLTFAFGRALLRAGPEPAAAQRIAGLAAVLLASAFGLVAEAHIAKTDAMLLAAVVAGQGALGLAYVRGRAGAHVPASVALAFWVAEAVAVLLKGPVAPALALLTAAVLSIADRDMRWLRNLRPLAGLALAALLIAPWVVALQMASEGHFLGESLREDLLAKLLGPQEAHGAPPFYYLLLCFATFWPGSVLIVPAIARAWGRHDMPVERFLLAWIVPAWIFLELVPTKLPHYALPLYPALALLAGSALAQGWETGRNSWIGLLDIAARVLWAIVTLVLAAALIVLPLRFGNLLPPGAVVGALALVGLGAALLRVRGRPVASGGLLAGLSLVLAASAGLSVLPGLDRLWLSRSVAAMVARNPPPRSMPVVAVGYSEPSLVFLLGGTVRLLSPPAAAEALAEGGDALVAGREEAMFRQALAARGLVAKSLDRVPGTDYSNGQRMVLTLYAVEPG